MQKQISLIKLKEKRKYNMFLTTREETLSCTLLAPGDFANGGRKNKNKIVSI
jgi:hypothetical protein